MAKIDRSESNRHKLPKGANILKTGAVYINDSTYKVVPNDGRKPYVSHKKLCIGKVCDDDRTMFYPNDAYRKRVLGDLPSPPEKSDSLSVGVHAAVRAADDKLDVRRTLKGSGFSEDESSLIMDLASYMVSEGRAVFQHYPTWARRNALYSSSVRSDSYISGFLRGLDLTRIGKFRDMWALSMLNGSSGKVYLCYDSTNVNSQAEGVSLVEKGHAKDDPELEQVNTEYVVRQQDGIPVTYMQYPGSVVDMAEAERMISYMGKVAANAPQVTLVCDRGYISEDNIKAFRKAGLDYLLLLKSNWDAGQKVLEKYGSSIKDIYSRYIKEHDVFGHTFPVRLLKGDEADSYVHLIYDASLQAKHRGILITRIECLKKELLNAVDRKVRMTEDNLNKYRELFDIVTEEKDTIVAPARGRGGKRKEQKSFIITSYRESDERIAGEFSRCGFFMMVSSENITCKQALDAYSKRDCVEKVFQALKSSLGMDKYGVHNEAAMQGKTFIWFIASIIRSSFSHDIMILREKTDNRKSYTASAAIEQLIAIEADRNLSDGKYRRRYALTKTQKEICSALGTGEKAIDEMIGGL